MPKNPTSPAGESAAGSALGLLPFALTNLGRPKLVRAVSVGLTAWHFGKMAWQAWNKLGEKTTPQVILYSNQGLFDYALLWLTQQQIIQEKANNRSFFVSDHGRDSRNESCKPVSPGGREERRPAVALLPADNVSFEWRGYKVTCSHERKSLDSDFTKNTSYPDKLSLGVEGAVEKTLLALVEDIQKVGTELSSTKADPWVYIWNWDWHRVRRCSHRGAILPDGQLEAIVSRIRDFQAKREWYESVGMPHRLGFLLHGIPGSGKTSTVLAVAALLEMDVYWLNPSNMSDEQLMQATSRVGNNDILLIEDSDCLNSTQKRGKTARPGKDNERITLAGLLNVIDGAVTRDGRVLFMTTNHLDRLDEALIRPGRIDVKLEYTHATGSQIAELAARFGHNGQSQALAESWSAEKISMAEVQERLIRLRGVAEC